MSTPSRSTPGSTRSAGTAIPTTRIRTHGSRSTWATAAASSARPASNTTRSPTPSSIRWCSTRATRVCGWRASSSPSRRFARSGSSLKPDGVFVMCNYYRQGFVVGRLVAMAERVFGTRPIVLSLPYQAQDRSRPAPAGRLHPRDRGPDRGRRRRAQEPLRARRLVLDAARPAEARGAERLQPRASGAARPRGDGLAEDRPGRGRDHAESAGSPPTTGRSSTSARPRSPRSTSGASPSCSSSRW